MSNPKLITTALRSTPQLAILSLNLTWTYMTLSWKVRRARRAFEKQLVQQGMPKKDAEQLSQFLDDFKDSITTTVKQGLGNAFTR